MALELNRVEHQDEIAGRGAAIKQALDLHRVASRAHKAEGAKRFDQRPMERRAQPWHVDAHQTRAVAEESNVDRRRSRSAIALYLDDEIIDRCPRCKKTAI